MKKLIQILQILMNTDLTILLIILLLFIILKDEYFTKILDIFLILVLVYKILFN